MSGTASLVRCILANDLRLYFRAWQRRKTRRIGGLALQLMFVGWMHLAIHPMLAHYDGARPMTGGVEMACLFVALLITMVAAQRSLEVLYNRGDLPMLLASPVPMRVVLLTRLADIQLTTWLSTGLVILPLLNVATWLHGAHWLWGWIGWLLAVLALVPLSLLTTVLAVRSLGPARARVFIQIGSILLGVAAIAGAQAPNWLSRSIDAQVTGPAQLAFFAHFDVPGLNQLAQAAHGDLRWLAALALVAGGLGFGAMRVLGREFTQGAQATASDLGDTGRKTPIAGLARAWQQSFRGSRARTIVRKEFRLVRRDPLLVVRSSAQMVSLLPALVGVLWLHTATGLAAFALVGPAIAAMTLATMMTVNDEAHLFVASSPLSPRRAAWARTAAAATLPAFFALALAFGTFLLHERFVALIAAIGGTLNAAALAWMGTCTVRPLSAEDRARQRQPKILGQYLFAMLLGGLGAGGVSAWSAGQEMIAAVLLAFALGTAGFAFMLRPRPWAEQTA